MLPTFNNSSFNYLQESAIQILPPPCRLFQVPISIIVGNTEWASSIRTWLWKRPTYPKIRVHCTVLQWTYTHNCSSRLSFFLEANRQQTNGKLTLRRFPPKLTMMMVLGPGISSGRCSQNAKAWTQNYEWDSENCCCLLDCYNFWKKSINDDDLGGKIWSVWKTPNNGGYGFI